jgi:hypothetical protein
LIQEHICLLRRHSIWIQQVFAKIDAVLSQKFHNKALDGFHKHPVTFNQADDYLNMQKNCPIRFDFDAGTSLARRYRHVLCPISSLVQRHLFLLALFAAIILDASFRGFSSAAGLSTSKRTSKIASACIARVGKKQDLTVAAPGQTAL